MGEITGNKDGSYTENTTEVPKAAAEEVDPDVVPMHSLDMVEIQATLQGVESTAVDSMVAVAVGATVPKSVPSKLKEKGLDRSQALDS